MIKNFKIKNLKLKIFFCSFLFFIFIFGFCILHFVYAGVFGARSGHIDVAFEKRNILIISNVNLEELTAMMLKDTKPATYNSMNLTEAQSQQPFLDKNCGVFLINRDVEGWKNNQLLLYYFPAAEIQTANNEVLIKVIKRKDGNFTVLISAPGIVSLKEAIINFKQRKYMDNSIERYFVERFLILSNSDIAKTTFLSNKNKIEYKNYNFNELTIAVKNNASWKLLFLINLEQKPNIKETDLLPYPLQNIESNEMLITENQLSNATYAILIAAPNEHWLINAVYDYFSLPSSTKFPYIKTMLDLRKTKSIAFLPFSSENNLSSYAGILKDKISQNLNEQNLFSIIERENLSQVLGEQALSSAGFISENSIKKAGELLGVDALVLGNLSSLYQNITYSLVKEKKEQKNKKGVIEKTWWEISIIKIEKTSFTASVRLVDTQTAQILYEKNLDGEKENRVVWYFEKQDYVEGKDPQLPTVPKDSYLVDAKLIHNLFAEKADKFVEDLVATAILPAPDKNKKLTTQTLNGKIINIDNEGIYINLGEEQGITTGTQFFVFENKNIKDPQTGEVLETIKRKIATLLVKEVYQKVSLTQVINKEENTTLKINDEVESY